MPGRVQLIDAGAGAFDALCEELARLRSGDPLRAISLVVPTTRAAVHIRRGLAVRAVDPPRRGIANVRLSTLPELFERLAGPEARARGKAPASRAVRLGALRAAARQCGGDLARLADHPATGAQLLWRYDEWRAAGAPACSEPRSESEGPLPLSSTSDDALVATCCSTARGLLAQDWYDRVDLAALAGELSADLSFADPSGPGGPDGGGRRYGPTEEAVIVHLLDALHPGELSALEAMGRAGEVCVQVAFVGSEVADRSAERLSGELGRRGLVVEDRREARRGPGPRVEVLAASEPGDEVAGVVREVLGALEAGVPADRVAVVWATRAPYGQLVAEALDRAGLCWSGPVPHTAAGSPSGRLAVHVVGAAARFSEQSVLARADLIELLGCAPVRDSTGRLVSFGEWDRAARLAGITSGDARAWRVRLERLANQDTTDERTRRACLEAALFVENLVAALAVGASCTSWMALSSWCLDTVGALVGIGSDGSHSENPDTVVAGIDQAVAAELSELADLDSIDPLLGLAPQAAVSRFASALEAGLERPVRPRGEVGRGVVVGNLDQVAGLDLELVAVLGCLEGSLPGRPPFGVLGAGGRPGASAVVERDTRRLGLCLAGTRRALLCHPAAPGGPSARTASRLLPEGPCHVSPSCLEALMEVGRGRLLACSPAEAATAELLAAASSSEALIDHHLVVSSARLAIAISVEGERRAVQVNRFTGLVGRRSHRIDGAMSATRLEHLARCPFRYLLEHELAAQPVDEPERRIELGPADRGQLMHRILERFVGVLLARGADPALLEEAEEEALLERIAEEELVSAEQAGLTGRPALWRLQRREILEALERERRADRRRRLAGLVPLAVEHRFGDAGQTPLVVGAGQGSLAIHGIVDRVDRLADGTIGVVDYKTGSPRSLRGVDGDPLDRGKRLQLSLYALAARADFGAEAPATPILASYRLLADPPSEHLVQLDTDLERRLGEVLGTLVDLLEEGRFPARPGPADRGSYESCRRCAFDPLCAPDRQERWQQVAGTPELAAYAALAEGGPPAEGDDGG